MTALAAARVGWCPGALAPMMSGDGLIVRVKPRGGRLAIEQARAIGFASRTYGNGELELTTRANLQIRGLSEGVLSDLVDGLGRVGLLESSPAAEAARNIVSSPLAGFDPTALFDIRPAVRALEARLAEDASLHAVPAKFSIVVEDGGKLGLSDVTADIRFEAFLDGAGPAFAVRLAGAEAVTRCRHDAIADTAAALIHVFLAARQLDDRLCRMRDLIGVLGVEGVFGRAGLGLYPPPARGGPARFEQFIGSFDFLGVAAPFGRLGAGQLEMLAGKAAESGVTEMRLTPWRAILVPGLEAKAVPGLAAHCARAGLIVDSADWRLRIAACAGAPRCHRGTTPVLDHATRLSARLGRHQPGSGVLVHVSGCGKGCAHAGKAPLTLVADNGRYGLVVDGRASDQPILRGLGFEEAAQCIKPSARTEPRS